VEERQQVKVLGVNLEAMIIFYMSVKSIDKTLKHFGISGVRAGNSYLSRKLKERNISVLNRRNSYAGLVK
jgi:hypothetical protein